MSRYLTKSLVSTVLFVSILVFTTPNADAEFVNGTETFAGTSLDLATWEAFRPQTISQNERLLFTNPSLQMTEYVTRMLTIPAGETVRAQVTLEAFDSSAGSVHGFACLILTSNESGNENCYIADERYAKIDLAVSTNFGPILVATSHGGGQVFHRFSESILGHTYWLELQRIAESEIRYAAYELDGTLSAETTRSLGLPSELYVGLVSNGTARFDNVSVPEPGSMMIMLTAFIASIFLLRTRHANAE